MCQIPATDQQQLEVPAETAAAAAECPPAVASAVEAELQQTNTDHHNNDDFPDFSELDTDSILDNEFDNEIGFQCDTCSSKFMSETSMRIHAAKCNKSRQLQSLQQSDDTNSRNELKRYRNIFPIFIAI